jgi:iron complex outermembrane receptor protein
MKTVDPNNNQFTYADQKSYSVFASADYDLTDRLSGSAEVRYSWDHKSEVLDDRLLNGSPLLIAFPPGSPQAAPSGSFSNFSWGLTGSYKFTPDIMAFLRVATAYRAGGFNAQLGKPCGPGDTPGGTCNLITPPPAYDPERSIDYELGLKTAWFEHRLLLNANVYDVETSDILANLNNGIPVMMDPLDGAMFLQNAGDASQWGFELEMIGDLPLPDDQGRITTNWTVSRQEGQFTSVPQLLSLTVAPGNSLARLRPYALRGDAVYTRPLRDGWTLQASATFDGEWGGYQGADNTQILDDHAIVGARLALQSRHLVFAVRATNLLDARYHTNGSGTQITPTKGDLFRLNNPRYVEGSVTWRW